LRRKVSRAALAVGLAIGACGLIAVPAEAADTLYFTNAPAVTGVTSITPESATVTGAVDTGGTPGTTFPVAAGTVLSWVGGLNILNSTSNVAVSGGNPSVSSISGGTDFSQVEFEYDTLADYTANGDLPGGETQYADPIEVPTSAGISPASVSLGAFGVTQQNNTGRIPLSPNTKYVYWITDQAGATDDAETVNLFNPASATAATSVNPTYACYPIPYIAQNAYLQTLTPTGTVSGGLTAPVPAGGVAQTTPEPEIDGPCIYYYGNPSGADTYTSPIGMFTTPALGRLAVSSVAAVNGTKATLSVTDKSAYKASGTIELTTSSGKELASGKFGIKAEQTVKVKLSLTGTGKTDLTKHTKAKLVLSSNWDQLTATKTVKL
jgi:hypothetical protein